MTIRCWHVGITGAAVAIAAATLVACTSSQEELAAGIPILPEIREYPLGEANTALAELKDRKIRGAKVLISASALSRGFSIVAGSLRTDPADPMK